MNRSAPIRRGAPPRRRTPLRASTTPIRKFNPERRARLRAEQYGPHGEWLKTLECWICWLLGIRQSTPTVPGHVAHTRGAGGKARDCSPLCVDHENEWHSIGRRTFDERYDTDMALVAEGYWAHSPYNPEALAA